MDRDPLVLYVGRGGVQFESEVFGYRIDAGYGRNGSYVHWIGLGGQEAETLEGCAGALRVVGVEAQGEKKRVGAAQKVFSLLDVAFVQGLSDAL